MNTKNPESYQLNNEIENKKDICVDNFICGIEGDIEKTISISGLSDDLKDKIVRKAISTLPFSYSETNDSMEVDLSKEDRSASYCFNGIDEWIRELTLNSDEYKQNGNQAFSQINKLYAATLFTSINRANREFGDTEDVEKIAASVEDQYFSISPCLISFVNKPSEKIELLSLADRSPISRLYMHDAIIAGICYDSTFSKNLDGIRELANDRDPISLIHLMQTELNMCMYASSNDWSESLLPKMLDAFNDIANRPEIPPLVRLIAQHEIDIVNDRLDMLNNSIPVSVMSKREFEKLHGSFNKDKTQNGLYSRNHLYGDKLLITIAPGIYADSTKGQLDYLVDDNDRVAPVSNWRPNNEFGIDQDDMFLIQMAHAPGVKAKIESELGVKLEDVHLDTQIYLLRFAIEANDGRYDNLVKELNKTKFDNESEKLELMEAFLALEFGDTFGDRLLTVSEKLDNKQSQEIYHNINKIRMDSRGIAKIFGTSADGLDQAVQTAWIKRVTEVLSVISDTEANEDDIKDAIGALNVIRYATEKVFEGLSCELTQLTNDGTEEFDGDGKKIDYRTYKSGNGLTVTMRRNREKIIVKTKDENDDEELKTRYRSPRIGFSIKIPAELIPDSAKTGNSKIDKDKRLNIRLDCDNDTSEFGSLSLDMGSLPLHCEGASQVALFIGKYFENVGDHLANGIKNGHQVREPFEKVKVNFDNFGEKIIDPIRNGKLTIIPYSVKSAA